jgi:dTDP-4-amino-4,6-dideoxygalactose transaminase
MQAAIPFIDLEAQQARIRDQLDVALDRVLAHGQYIMGPEVGDLEAALSAFCGAPHTVACASGTDALALALMAFGVRRGDAILIPTFTFAATAEVVPLLGAVPVFVDVHADSFNLDPESLEAGTSAARRAGLRPVGIIAVDLFGQPADYDAIHQVAEAHGLWVVADAAQSFGASWRDRKVGTLAKLTTTSFFPAKPLGCYGDGGAVFTDDPQLAAVIRSLRVHGQGEDKYDNVRIGMNARLDTVQAAILLAKLEIFADEIEARQRAAARYEALLAGVVATPCLREGASSTWAQYTVRSPDRDGLRKRLATSGIPTAVYYSRPLHRQTAYRDFPTAAGGCPIAERIATEVLSLPMHAYLDAATQEKIAVAVCASSAATAE